MKLNINPKIWFVFAFSLILGTVYAVPKITVDKIAQRYPWNGMVDVTFTVTGAVSNHLYETLFRANVSGVIKQVKFTTKPHTINGIDSYLQNGTFTAAWNSKTSGMYYGSFDTNALFYATVTDLGPEEFPEDATGLPEGVVADIMVVDLSRGHTSTNYNATFYSHMDVGRFNCDIYKTRKMPMILIPGGKHYVFKGTTVTFAYDYYIGMFPVTQKQYENVIGSIPASRASQGGTHPLMGAQWSTLRGTSSSAGALTGESSFLFRLKENTYSRRNKINGWDLPTEALWRAAAIGYQGWTYVCGTNVSEVANYAWCEKGAPTTVGMRRPNNKGLFDCWGNVHEFVLDSWTTDFDVDCSDIPNLSGAYKTICGGSYSSTAASLTIDSRGYFDPPRTVSSRSGPQYIHGTGIENTGFRAACKVTW